jgi:two-component system sensor histidine kinase QseC
MRLLPRLKSLQARLLALLLSAVTVVWLGAAAFTWQDTRHELDELLDSHLAQAAALLVVQQVNTDHDDDDPVADAPSLHKYAPKVAFQVFHEGQLVTRSANAGLTPMTRKSNGFSTVMLNDAQWRVFATQGGESDVQVYVGEQTETRDDILGAVLSGVLLPLGVALPLLALLLWWAVRHGLSPLRQLSQALGRRQPQALAPLVLTDVPTEMEPLLHALNGLLGRIEAMVASERRFTADAAHELRTPIAAIRAQAQVALGAGNDAAQRDHALQFTLAGCDRATRLVEQLLTLSRLEATPSPGAAPPLNTAVDLSALTRRICADLAPAALQRQQELVLDAPTVCLVTGDDVLLGVLVRNLIDNALRYSPPGATAQVSVTTRSDQPELQVNDSGPGMTPADIARLGERFYRVLGNEQPGSGLGWSIVRRISAVVGARIGVSRSADLGGLCVTVTWPAR